MRRILGLFLAALLGVAGVVGLAPVTAAMAWSYCANPPSVPGKLNLYKWQGYCGPLVALTPPANGQEYCDGLTNDGLNDFVGSVWNRSNRIVILYHSDICDNAELNFPLNPNTSHPDLTRISRPDSFWLYHNVEGVRWYG